jgi:hypothetical protein
MLKKPPLKAIHIYNSLRPTHKPKIVKEYVFANASKFAERKARQVTMYKKHRAFVLKRKVCAYLQSPLNIKFGVYKRKDKSKIFIFS